MKNSKTEEKVGTASIEKIMKILKKKGYHAYNENGIIMFLYETKEEYQELSTNIKNYLDSLGYHGSIGIRGVPESK